MDLKPGEIICDKCHGKGVMTETVQKKKNFFVEKNTCNKCHGDGKLDWIENITGKEEKEGKDPWFHGFTWSYNYNIEQETKWKKSSREIIENIDPKARKRLERKIAYNLSR